ncbi:MAG: glycosyltransferase family 2 protein, partial [Gammaproteobacteria bacterium]
LEKQSIGASEFELILVDNNSDWYPDESRDPVFAKRLYCTTPGSYAARNAGVAKARAGVFVFTDADCRPDPEWLLEGMRCVYGPGEGRAIVAGAVVMRSRDPERPARYELYDLIMGIPQERYVQRGYGVTANLFVPRKVCERLGGFDEKRFSGGDAEFCRRAGRMNIPVLYCGAAKVSHPARRTMDELVRKVRRVKGGQITAGPLWRRMSYAVYTFVPPLRVWKEAFSASGFSVWERLGVCAIQLRLWAAEIAELFRQLLKYSPERR